MNENEARAAAREQVEDSGFVSAVTERIGSAAGVTAVFGEPVEREGVTVIPVARSCWGAGGGGGGESDDEGFGAGGGAMTTPQGFIEIAGGKARYRRLRSPLRLALALLGAVLAGAGAAELLRRLGS
jgi:uncharacterized spore protein YtfJ